jgi:hypothetical protein
MVEFNKKVIVVAKVWNLGDKEFLLDAAGKGQALIDHALYVPNLSPTAASLMTKVGDNTTIMQKRDALLADAKALTTTLNKGRNEINNIIVSKWPSQIQDAVAGDIAKIQELHYDVKNLESQPEVPPVSVTNSIPVIDRVDYNLPLHHTIYISNSVDLSNLVPDDVDYADVYETFDEANTKDLKRMSHLGKAKRGKFVNHFGPEDENKDVWYVVVYVPKKEGVIPALSVAFKAKVV